MMLKESGWYCSSEPAFREYLLEWGEVVQLFEQQNPLFEAEALTNRDISRLFKAAEIISQQGSHGRTGLGKAIDIAGIPSRAISKINQKVEELIVKAQKIGAVDQADQKFEKMLSSLAQKAGGDDSKIVRAVKRMREFAKDNPVKMVFIIGAGTAAGSLLAGPLGAAGAAAILKMASEVLKGEKLSAAVARGVTTGAVGGLAGLSMSAIGDLLAQGASKIMPVDVGQANISTSGASNSTSTGFKSYVIDVPVYGTKEEIQALAQSTEQAVELWRNGDFEGFRSAVSDIKARASEITSNNREWIEQYGDPREILSKIQQRTDQLAAMAAGAAAGATAFDKQGKPVKENIDEELIELKARAGIPLTALEEGIWDNIKQGAKRVAKGAVNKVTFDKLAKAWKKAGAPRDAAKIAKFLLQAGLSKQQLRAAAGKAGVTLNESILGDNIMEYRNDMRKLMNLMESAERLDEAAPGLSEIGVPKEMIQKLMSRANLEHDVQPEKMDTRPTVAYARRRVILRKTRQGEWYALYPLTHYSLGGGFAVIGPDGKIHRGDKFAEVRPHFGKGASEYWSLNTALGGATRRKNRHEEPSSKDPLKGEGYIHTYMNRVFLPGLQRKAGKTLDRIFANMRKLHRGTGHRHMFTTSYKDSEREDALHLAAMLEDMMEKGFNQEMTDDFLRAAGAYSSGWGSIPSNQKSFAELIQEPLGRHKFAQTMLKKIREIDRRFEKLMNQSEKGRQEREAERRAWDDVDESRTTDSIQSLNEEPRIGFTEFVVFGERDDIRVGPGDYIPAYGILVYKETDFEKDFRQRELSDAGSIQGEEYERLLDNLIDQVNRRIDLGLQDQRGEYPVDLIGLTVDVDPAINDRLQMDLIHRSKFKQLTQVNDIQSRDYGALFVAPKPPKPAKKKRFWNR